MTDIQALTIGDILALMAVVSLVINIIAAMKNAGRDTKLREARDERMDVQLNSIIEGNKEIKADIRALSRDLAEVSKLASGTASRLDEHVRQGK